MKINRHEYNKLPFTIQVGALELWATELTSYQKNGRLHQLYRFNDFFAELAYNEQDVASKVYTFTTNPIHCKSFHKLIYHRI